MTDEIFILNQGFPLVNAPFVDIETGRINQTWLQLLIAMWNRTGQGPGLSTDEALAFGALGKDTSGGMSADEALVWGAAGQQAQQYMAVLQGALEIGQNLGVISQSDAISLLERASSCCDDVALLALLGAGGQPNISTAINIGGANLWQYKAKTGVTAGDPGSGYIIWNNATQVSATQINLSHLSDDGIDVDLFIQTIASGDVIYVQDRDDSTNFQKFTCSGAITVSSGYVQVPVTFVTSGGTGTTNFSNNQKIFVARFSASVSVPVGANPTATAGPTAINGTAATFMPSDAAPAVQIGSASQKGLLQVDGTTITVAAGVISAVGGAGTIYMPVVSGTSSAGLQLVGNPSNELVYARVF